MQTHLAAALLLAVCSSSGAVEPPANSNKPQKVAASAPSDRLPAVISTGMRSTNLERSIRWYTEGLGMVVVRRISAGPLSEVILSFPGKVDQAGLMVFQAKGAEEVLPVEHGNTHSKVVLGVADAAAVAARLTTAGYVVGAIHQSGPYRTLIAHDPDGYEYEIVQMPPPGAGH